MSPLTRRRFLGQLGALTLTGGTEQKSKRVAAVVTQYRHNSHADVLVSRLLQGYNLDGWPPGPRLELVSLYTDQVPKNDISRRLSREYGFPVCPTIADALTLGHSTLAVDGVLLIGEHGEYPLSSTGQILYPRRRFFEETVSVFEHIGARVPVFSDKHLAWNWEDARWMVDTARRLNIPLMAGSSLPGAWRHPPVDARPGARLTEAVGLSYGPLEGYGYHGLEAMQAIVERRHGGETGVKAVQVLQGEAVWQAAAQGRFDLTLFEAAASRREAKGRFTGTLQRAMQPAAFFVDYLDGFRAALIHDLGAANSEWVTAWREEGRAEPLAVVHVTQEARPFGHFTFLLQGIERMMLRGKPSWPVERTLLVTGILAAGFQSRLHDGGVVETPHLAIRYRPSAPWRQPPPPPPDRPLTGQ